MSEITEGQFKSPFVRSGPDKGRIRNPNVAQTVYNTLSTESKQSGARSKTQKIKFFKEHGDDNALVRQASDTVKQEEKAKRFQEESAFDYLTGLHIQKSFEPDIEDEITALKEGRIQSLGVIRMDLDYFSWLNNILESHSLADYFLSTVGRTIKYIIRSQDKGYRIGGDEFGIIVRDTFTAEDFLHIVDRIHKELNNKILQSTFDTLLQSKRTIRIENGKKEREGTFALRQFLSGLDNLLHNVDGRQDHFLLKGRGGAAQKQAFLDRLSIQKPKIFNRIIRDYLEDNRVWDELDSNDQNSRLATEWELADTIQEIMSDLTISTGSVFFTQDNIVSFPRIDACLEAQVNKIKRAGGGKYIAQIGTEGSNITNENQHLRI